MEFVLLLEDREGEARRAPVSPEDMGKFGRELAERGALRAAAGPLRPTSEAVRVRVRDGRAAVTAGPFAESHEVVVGFFALDVPDRAAAIEVAKRCPFAHAGIVDVHAGRYQRAREATGAPQFLLLYPLDRSLPRPDESVLQDGMRQMRAFTDELTREGRALGDGALPPAVPATRVEIRPDRPLVTDGPFSESKEIMPGFLLIEAADRAEAIAIAQRVPHAKWGAVEVREVERMSTR